VLVSVVCCHTILVLVSVVCCKTILVLARSDLLTTILVLVMSDLIIIKNTRTEWIQDDTCEKLPKVFKTLFNCSPIFLLSIIVMTNMSD